MNPRAGEGYDVEVLGDRVIAQIVDGILGLALAFALFIGLSALVGVAGQTTEATAAVEVLSVMTLLIAFLSVFVYNVVLEHYWAGQTVGKRLMGIRVLDENGREPSLGQIVVRNIPAIISLGLFSIIAALLSISMSDKNQRMFDVAADTIVAEEGVGSGSSDPRPTRATQL